MKRETFGKTELTEAAALRKKHLAEMLGWMALKVERVQYHKSVVRFKLTGIPMFKRIQELFGCKEGPINAPRSVNAKRRKGQSYRFGGS